MGDGREHHTPTCFPMRKNLPSCPSAHTPGQRRLAACARDESNRLPSSWCSTWLDAHRTSCGKQGNPASEKIFIRIQSQIERCDVNVDRRSFLCKDGAVASCVRELRNNDGNTHKKQRFAPSFSAQALPPPPPPSPVGLSLTPCASVITVAITAGFIIAASVDSCVAFTPSTGQTNQISGSACHHPGKPVHAAPQQKGTRAAVALRTHLSLIHI